MNKDQVKGKLKDAAGKVQKEVGKLVDSPSQQIKGVMLQTEGKAQHHLGDAKEVVKDNRLALKEATSKNF